MKRLALVSALTTGVLLIPSAAMARDVYVGNCANGRITTVSNSNAITGDTNVIICDVT